MSEEEIQLSDANNGFCAELYQNGFLPQKLDTKNLIFSPYSLHTVLSMLCLGAEENSETRAQLVDGLQFEDEVDNDSICKRYLSVVKSFKEKADFTLYNATKVYCKAGFKLNPAYVKAIQDTFLTKMEQVDISKANCKASASKINKWVSESTDGKIKDIISAESLDKDTRLLLINAIYFKGKWAKQFAKSKTVDREFHLEGSKTNKVKVKMMSMLDKFRWKNLKDLDATACSLPYKGNRLAMVIILPNKIDGLAKIQGSLDTYLKDKKTTVKKSFSKEKVNLKLPKFTFETNVKGLKDALELLQMDSMFSDKYAEFGNMIAEDEDEKKIGLYVSEVIHKAYIEVDEEGTTAAAVTYAKMSLKKTSCKKKRETIRQFICDRPFYFQIIDKNNGDLVLFAGHCVDPRS